MNLPTLTVQQQYEVLRTGEYRCKVASLEVVESPFEPKREQVKFTLELTDPVHSGRRLTAYCSLSTSPKAKLIRWAQALLNRTFTAGDALNLADLIGREGVAVVVVKQGDKGEYNRVEDLLPAPAQPVQAQATPTPVQAQAQPQATPVQPVQANDPFSQ